MKTHHTLRLVTAYFVLLLSVSQSRAQVGIGTSDPHPSAMLDIQSTSKGVLIPRMLSSDRINIQNPETGLVVYQKDAIEGFYMWDGTSWKNLPRPLKSSTVIPFSSGYDLVEVKNTSGTRTAAILGAGAAISGIPMTWFNFSTPETNAFSLTMPRAGRITQLSASFRLEGPLPPGVEEWSMVLSIFYATGNTFVTLAENDDIFKYPRIRMQNTANIGDVFTATSPVLSPILPAGQRLLCVFVIDTGETSTIPIKGFVNGSVVIEYN